MPYCVQVRSGNEVDGEWVAGQLSFKAPSGDLPASLPAKPLVLLTNSSTASASEVLAGALHDNGRWVPPVPVASLAAPCRPLGLLINPSGPSAPRCWHGHCILVAGGQVLYPSGRFE